MSDILRPPLDYKARPIALMENLKGNRKLAVLYPGLFYTLKAPLFFYLSEALAYAGWDVVGIDYRYPEDPAFTSASDDEKDRWLNSDSLAVGSWVGQRSVEYDRTCIVAKSLGTTMLANQIDAGLIDPNIDLVWLTPGNSVQAIYDVLGGLANRSFVAYGTADAYYEKTRADRARNWPRVSVCEVHGAGHVFEVKGDLRQSITNVADVLESVMTFLGAEV